MEEFRHPLLVDLQTLISSLRESGLDFTVIDFLVVGLSDFGFDLAKHTPSKSAIDLLRI